MSAKTKVDRQSYVQLRRCWIQWRAIVASIWRKRRSPINHEAYAYLHQQLLFACRAYRRTERRLSDNIEKLISPWSNVESLEHTDRKILSDVLARCAPIDHALHHQPKLSGRIATGALVLGLIGAAAFMIWIMRADANSATSVHDSLRDLLAEITYRTRLAVSQHFNAYMLGAVVILIVIVGAMMTTFAKKT